MNISTQQLIDAKEAAGDLIEQLGLKAYVFGIEPHAGPWEVRVECGHGGMWQSVTLMVDAARLRASRDNATERTQLLKEWGERLAACRYPGRAPE